MKVIITLKYVMEELIVVYVFLYCRCIQQCELEPKEDAMSTLPLNLPSISIIFVLPGERILRSFP